MKTISSLLGLGFLLMACGGGDKPPPNTPKTDKPGPAVQQDSVSAGAQAKFNAALDAFVEHDKANDWNDANCAAVAKQFDDATSAQGGEVRPSDLQRGPRLSALQRRRPRKGEVRAGVEGRPEVPRASRAPCALPVQSGRQRGQRDQRAPAGRRRRAVPERSCARQLGHVPDAA